jgi:hypothetical protein
MTIRVHIHGVRSYTFIMCTTYTYVYHVRVLNVPLLNSKLDHTS